MTTQRDVGSQSVALRAQAEGVPSNVIYFDSPEARRVPAPQAPLIHFVALYQKPVGAFL